MKRATGRHTSAAPGVDRVLSNLKTWLRGTQDGVGADHLDAYLDGSCFGSTAAAIRPPDSPPCSD